MKRKQFVILISAILLIIVGVLMFQERGNFKVIDYNGDPIYYLDKNKKPFKIESKNKVTVNGVPYEAGTGIYEVGTYEIVSGMHKKKVVIAPIEKSNTYDFYFIGSERASLFSSLFLGLNDHSTYVWSSSNHLFNKENLKKNGVKLSSYFGLDDHFTEALEEAKKEVGTILAADENAYFHLYLSDSYYQTEFSLLGIFGLNKDRYEVTYFSDGASSYDQKLTMDGDFYQAFLNRENEFLRNVDLIKETKVDPKVIQDPSIIYTMIKEENHRYFLEYPELVIGTDEKIQEELKDAHLNPTSFLSCYQKLTEDGQKQAMEYLNLKKDGRKELTELDKPYLILSLNDVTNTEYTEEQLHNLIDQVLGNYQDSYHIVVQKTELSETLNIYLQEHNITVLQEDLSLEYLSLSDFNYKVGGFFDESYSNLSKETILFLFGNDSSLLEPPFSSIYQDLLFLKPISG